MTLQKNNHKHKQAITCKSISNQEQILYQVINVGLFTKQGLKSSNAWLCLICHAIHTNKMQKMSFIFNMSIAEFTPSVLQSIFVISTIDLASISTYFSVTL